MLHLSAPVEVSLEITNTCNLLCVHCYSSSGPGRIPNELTYEEITRLIDELVALKVFRLQLVGGEPFIRRDTVQVVGYAKDKGMAVTCSSNGWFLDDATLMSLKRHGIDNIQVSIDGATPATHDRIRARQGSFVRAVDAARRAKVMGIPITIGSTMMRSNVAEIRSIVDLALAVRADALHIMGLQPGGRGKEHFFDEGLADDDWIGIVKYFEAQRDRLEPILAVTIQGPRFAFINRGLMSQRDLAGVDPLDAIFTNCDCGKARCVIDSKGNVFPCDMWRVADMNIRSEPFGKIWKESNVLRSFRNRDVHRIPECRGCPYADACRGGCAATALNILGRIDAADPRCEVATRER